MIKSLIAIFKQITPLFIALTILDIILFIVVLSMRDKINLDTNTTVFLIAVFVVNIALALFTYTKNIILPYLFIVVTIIVEMLLLTVHP